jgi:hypothetical protein
MKTKLIGKYTQAHLAHIHNGVLEENGVSAFILFSILSAILLVLPFGNFQRQYFCKECGFKTNNR